MAVGTTLMPKMPSQMANHLVLEAVGALTTTTAKEDNLVGVEVEKRAVDLAVVAVVEATKATHMMPQLVNVSRMCSVKSLLVKMQSVHIRGTHFM